MNDLWEGRNVPPFLQLAYSDETFRVYRILPSPPAPLPQGEGSQEWGEAAMKAVTSLRRDALIVLVAALVTVAYSLAAASAAGEPGFPLDNSWIHQTYARNLAQTGQWAFIPGTPSAGSTSPLYTLLLTAGYALNVPFFAWTTFVGAAALALCGLAGARVAEHVFPGQRQIGLWTGLALVTSWHLVWAAASGMETMLFGALTLVVILLALRETCAESRANPTLPRGRLGFGLVCALLVAARPEGVMLAGLAGLAVLVADSARGSASAGWPGRSAWRSAGWPDSRRMRCSMSVSAAASCPTPSARNRRKMRRSWCAASSPIWPPCSRR